MNRTDWKKPRSAAELTSFVSEMSRAFSVPAPTVKALGLVESVMHTHNSAAHCKGDTITITIEAHNFWTVAHEFSHYLQHVELQELLRGKRDRLTRSQGGPHGIGFTRTLLLVLEELDGVRGYPWPQEYKQVQRLARQERKGTP